MGARQKLNNVYLHGALLWSTAAGLLTQSAVVFAIVLALRLLWNVADGEIRPDRRNKKRLERDRETWRKR
jgi:hypothetical protein